MLLVSRLPDTTWYGFPALQAAGKVTNLAREIQPVVTRIEDASFLVQNVLARNLINRQL